MFETALDRQIFKAIQGRTADNPQTLSGILWCVDAAEKLVLSAGELNDGLRRLIHAGQIAEIGRHKYCDAGQGGFSKAYSGVNGTEYASAVRDYHRMFNEERRRLDEESETRLFVWQKLALRWATPNQRFPNEIDEDGAERLAEAIEFVLAPSGLGEINGFEIGRGHVDVLIFGKATDSDVDQLYELLSPVFREFPCPKGSSLIRYYAEGNREVESDRVQ